MSSSKANYFLTVFSGIVITVGILIRLLAFFVLMLLGRLAYMDMILAFGVSVASVWVFILIGLTIMGAITAGNIHSIRKKNASLWPQEKLHGSSNSLTASSFK